MKRSIDLCMHMLRSDVLSRRYVVLAAIAVVVLAFGVRVGMTSAFVGLGAPPDAEANVDQVDFEQLAYHVASGQGFTLEDHAPTARRAPGAVFTFAPAYWIVGRDFAAMRLWIIALSVATCLLCMAIGWQLAGPGAGLLAGLGLAVYPGHAYYAMHMLSETPFAFWLAAAVFCSLVAHRFHASSTSLLARWGWVIASGVAFAMLVLTKPQFLLLAPLAVGWIGWRMWRDRDARGLGHPQRWVAAAVTLSVATVLVVPWGLRNHAAVGVTGLSSIVGLGLWGGNNERVLDDPVWRGRWLKISELERQLNAPLPAGEAAANAEAKRRGMAFIREHPGEMPALMLSKVGRLLSPWPRTSNPAVAWSEAIAWMTLAPFATLGLWTVIRRRPEAWPVLVAPLLVTLATTVMFFGIVRYRNALAPILVALGAVGMANVLAYTTSLLKSKAQTPSKTQPFNQTAAAHPA